MDLEGLNTERAEHMRSAFKAMQKILEDEHTSVKEKVEAARTMDAMSDSIIKAYLAMEAVRAGESVAKSGTKSNDRLHSQLDKLIDKKDDNEYE